MTTDYGSWQALAKAQAVEQRTDMISAALSAGWVATSIVSGWGAEFNNAPRVKIFPNNIVFLRGGVILPAGGGYNVVQWGWVGAGYIPFYIARWPAVPLAGTAYGNVTYPGAPRVFLDTSGSLTLSGIPSSLNSTTVEVSGWYALD